jgi:hypothetical protein
MSPTVCLIVCVITETPKGALCPSWGRKESEWMNERLLAFQGVSPFFFREVKCRFVWHASFLLSGKKVLCWHFLSGNAVWSSSREVPCCGLALSGSPLRQSPPVTRPVTWLISDSRHSAYTQLSTEINGTHLQVLRWVTCYNSGGGGQIRLHGYSVELRSCKCISVVFTYVRLK